MTAGAIPVSQWRPAHNPWVITVVVSMAAFMEVLDTSIANVALPHIAGAVSASYDESTWVLTSYLVANAIVLPISGWLVSVFGRKRFFMTCILLFSVSSLLCGLAPSLGWLLFFRILQGAAGGGLQPMAQAILADTFPPETRGLAFSLYGVTAVLAPLIGPTLGGWLTDNYSWRWIFLINLPVGMLAVFLVFHVLEDPPFLHRIARGGVKLDYVGFGLLALGVGALQVLLDKGQQDDWFSSQLIVVLAILAVVCLTTLGIWEWYHEHPIVDVHLFKNLNFTSSNFMLLMLGVVYFSSLVMMPRFLQTLLGYTAEQAGLVLSASGFLLLGMLPLVGRLTTRFQARHLVALGWALVAASMFISAKWLDLNLTFGAARWLRVFQSAGLPLLFVPITLAAYVGLAPEQNTSAAGLLNFMRNMGASIGTSLVTTVIARRAQFHQVQLVPRVANDNATFREQLAGLTQRLAASGLGEYEAKRQALGRIYQSVLAQAETLAYVDTFWMLGAAAVVMFLLSFALERNEPGAGGQATGH
jgi:MFS transporter, DHA2 family, multidrug resistance protein